MTDVQPERKLDFAALLSDHARGEVNDEVTAALMELVQAVGPTGKAGSVTLEVTVAPAGGSGRTVNLSMKCKAKIPVADPEMGVFFVDRTGALRRDDPFQEKLAFANIPVEPSTPPVHVDPETGEIINLPNES